MAVFVAFCVATVAFGALGVFLMVHDFPVFGGIVVFLALLGLGSIEVKSGGACKGKGAAKKSPATNTADSGSSGSATEPAQ